MSDSILYYPTIEFRQEDYQWLWRASLLWDKIYRIVPPGYIFNEPENIRILCETGDIGKPLSPVTYAKAASDEFALFMEKHSQRAAALSDIDNTYYSSLSRVHPSKIDETLKDQCVCQTKM